MVAESTFTIYSSKRRGRDFAAVRLRHDALSVRMAATVEPGRLARQASIRWVITGG